VQVISTQISTTTKAIDKPFKLACALYMISYGMVIIQDGGRERRAEGYPPNISVAAHQ
jgi:hypothetical protein